MAIEKMLANLKYIGKCTDQHEGENVTPMPRKKTLIILFIGNIHTYLNDMPIINY